MAREIICGIYKITNLINGKVYIGQAKNIYKRWAEHKRARDNNCPLLYKAIRKYGVDNFSFEIQEVCSQDELDQKEIYWIKYYNSCVFFENGWGYNCNEGGAEGKGYIPSLETREKMSKIKLEEGVWCSKPVICDGVEFNSTYACEKYYGLNKGIMSNWLSLKYSMPDEFVEKQLRYKDAPFRYKKREINSRRNVEVEVDGIKFNKIGDCASYLEVSSTRLIYWLNTAMPKQIHERGLKYVSSNYQTTLKTNQSSTSSMEIVFNGQVYHTFKKLAETIGCNPATISNFVKTRRTPKILENTEFIFNGEILDTTYKKKEVKQNKTSRWVSVYFDGKIYENLQLLADVLGKSRNTVKYWFDTRKLPKIYGDIEFYYLKGGENGCEKK